jgi:hypothetical protein
MCTGVSHQSETRLGGEVRPRAGLELPLPVPFFESCRDVDVNDGPARAHNININAQVFREIFFARHASFT